jgi:hypothetical protein
LHRSIRISGFEVKADKLGKGMANTEKLDENTNKTRGRIFELAYCNQWDYFITLTISGDKHNRYDLHNYHKDLSQWIRNYNKKYATDIKYLLIPEMHKNGAWHEHGFLMGIPESHLKINENGYLDWLEYKSKFGYCSIDKVHNQEAAAKYITKYISKNLSDCVKQVNAKMYYCSQGLRRSVEIKRGTLSANSIPWDFENDWIKSKWYKNEDMSLLKTIIT